MSFHRPKHHRSKRHSSSHHRRGYGYSGGAKSWSDWISQTGKKAYDAVKPYATVENAKKAADMAEKYVPKDYQQYVKKGRSFFGFGKHGVPMKRTRAKSPYNELVGAVAREKFAGHPKALTMASRHVKANGMYKSGGYMSGKVGHHY